MPAAIGFLQAHGFSGKRVPVLFRTRWEQNASVPPDLGSDRSDDRVLEQPRHQARDDNKHACRFGLPDERNNVIGFRALNRQRQLFSLPKKICLLLTQA